MIKSNLQILSEKIALLNILKLKIGDQVYIGNISYPYKIVDNNHSSMLSVSTIRKRTAKLDINIKP